MSLEVARQLLLRPPEQKLRELLNSGGRLFWVDWRESDDDIVRSVSVALHAPELSPRWDGEHLQILYRGQATPVHLRRNRGDRDVTLWALNEALAGQFEIRLARDSDGADTLAFLVLECATWQSLAAEFGAQLDQVFQVLGASSPLFGEPVPEKTAEDALNLQLAAMRFEHATCRLIPADRVVMPLRGNAPAETHLPVVEPFAGDLALIYFRDLKPNAGASEDPHWIRHADLRKYGMTPAQLHQFALRWMATTWREMTLQRAGAIGQIKTTGSVAAPTVALCQPFWQQQAEKSGPQVLAFVAPDRIVFAPASDDQAVGLIRQELAVVAGRTPGPLSSLLYLWQPAGWQVFR